MRQIFLGILAGAALIYAQSAPKPAEFEVASVRPSAQGMPSAVNIGLHVDGAQVRCTYLSINDYIGMAYRVKNYQINGPDWIKSDRFDISAKIPEGATREQVPEMLGNLLESRFRMKFHREPKPFPVYALIVAKGGLKINALPEDTLEPNEAFDVKVSGGRDGVFLKLGKNSSFGLGNNKLEAKHLTMTGLADMLARFVDRPVVDMTELKGGYDFTVDLTPEDVRSMTIRSAIAAGVTLPPEALRLLEGASDSSLHAGLQALGLKLEPRKAPIDTFVVDKIEKTPTEN